MSLSRRMAVGLLVGLVLGPMAARAEGGGWNYENVSIGVYGGYAGTDFSTLEKHFRERGADYRQNFIDYLVYTGSNGTASYTVKEVTGSIQAGADMLYWLNGTIGVGGRLNLLMPSTLELSVQGEGAYQETYEYQQKISSFLLSPMLEICLRNRIGSTVELNLVVAGGLGWSSATLDYSSHLTDPFYGLDEQTNMTATISGTGFHLLAGANLGVRLSEHISLFANAGYNYCNIGEMKYTETLDLDGDGLADVDKDTIYGDPDTRKAYNFDFSGMFFGGGLQFTL
ncbi:MAG: outer membrane beta-barrel protein [candidate division FCPU426 bacterium]